MESFLRKSLGGRKSAEGASEKGGESAPRGAVPASTSQQQTPAPSLANPPSSSNAVGGTAMDSLRGGFTELKLSAEQRAGREPVFEGTVSELGPDGQVIGGAGGAGRSGAAGTAGGPGGAQGGGPSPHGGGTIITTRGGPPGREQVIRYQTQRVVGNGSFGVVFSARCVETGESVAIKKVLQDKRFKNRELQIIRTLQHPNVVHLKHCFYTTNEKEEVYLNLVLEFVPDTVYRINKHYSKNEQRMPLILVKLYVYQMLRSLGYIHGLGICHRDVKPQNLLVDISTHSLKLCDFGSAKSLISGEPNISYICSRYYRAPELIFGATDYSCAIDVWSVGCVAAELLLGSPLFPGESGVDQLVEIIKVLGTPTREEIHAMNPNYTEFKFPQIKAHPWSKVFSKRMPQDAVDLISKLLVYSPTRRLDALAAMTHPFFDELRDPATRLPNNRPLPPLFNWVPGELDRARPEVRAALQPGSRREWHDPSPAA